MLSFKKLAFKKDSNKDSELTFKETAFNIGCDSLAEDLGIDGEDFVVVKELMTKYLRPFYCKKDNIAPSYYKEAYDNAMDLILTGVAERTNIDDQELESVLRDFSTYFYANVEGTETSAEEATKAQKELAQKQKEEAERKAREDKEAEEKAEQLKKQRELLENEENQRKDAFKRKMSSVNEGDPQYYIFINKDDSETLIVRAKDDIECVNAILKDYELFDSMMQSILYHFDPDYVDSELETMQLRQAYFSKIKEVFISHFPNGETDYILAKQKFLVSNL